MSAPPMLQSSGSDAYCVDTSHASPCTIRLLDDTQANASPNRPAHCRKLDLSMRIHVHFPDGSCQDYTGTYLAHGLSKTVFVLSASRADGRFEGCVLKMARTIDPEPFVFMRLPGIGPEVLRVVWAELGPVRYYCWICERVVPMDEVAKQPDADRERCVTGVCHVMIRAALKGLIVDDCHFYNFGLRVREGAEAHARSAAEHSVVILDAGSRGLVAAEPSKKDVNRCMSKLWHWAKSEIQAECEETAAIWRSSHSLQDARQGIADRWEQRPFVTKGDTAANVLDHRVQLETQLLFTNFLDTTEAKVIDLVGRHAGRDVWTEHLRKTCWTQGRRLARLLDEPQKKVMEELYRRLTRDKHQNEYAREKTDGFIAFWMQLQIVRSKWLSGNHKDPATFEVSHEHIQAIKREWERTVAYHDLTWEQKRKPKCSIFNAMFHSRSGWVEAGTAAIRYRIPTMYMGADAPADAAEHIRALGEFARELVLWLQAFASGLAEYWLSDEYKKARQDSGTSIETHGLRTRSDGQRDVPV